MVKEKGGLDFALQKMESFRDEALTLLDDFPQDKYRDALALMVNYVIERKV